MLALRTPAVRHLPPKGFITTDPWVTLVARSAELDAVHRRMLAQQLQRAQQRSIRTETRATSCNAATGKDLRIAT